MVATLTPQVKTLGVASVDDLLLQDGCFLLLQDGTSHLILRETTTATTLTPQAHSATPTLTPQSKVTATASTWATLGGTWASQTLTWAGTAGATTLTPQTKS